MTYIRVSALLIFLGIQAHLLGIEVSDIHDIYKINAAHVFEPRTVRELQNIVAYANEQNMPISIAGKRHTQGGQTLYENGLFVDMVNFNQIVDIDVAHELITVQPGATWREVQAAIKPHGLAVRAMQYFNNFTVGGSLGVNCNSHDTQNSLLIDTVQSIKILTADGAIVTADRTQNYDLFRCAIGGYGLFGIIFEATLKLTKDSEFIRKLKLMPTEQYLEYFQKNLRNNKHVSFHFARLNTGANKLFKKALVTTCYEPHQKRSMGLPAAVYNATTHPAEFELVREFDLLKDAHFWVESHLPKHWRMTRNEVMTLQADHIPLHGPQPLNVLEEYFIPVEQLNVFLARLKPILKSNKVNLVYFLIRYLPQNTESFLSYAQRDTMSIVMFMTHERTEKAYAHHKLVNRAIIDLVLDLGGTYYLVVQGNATREQLKISYPQIDDFFAKKSLFDSKGVFKNMWFDQYKV